MEGSHLEDTDPSMCRASNHFHDPLRPWDTAGLFGYQGKVSLVVDAKCSATIYTQKNSNVVWATGYLSPSPDGAKRYTNNEMDWYNARNFYYKALTGTSTTDRETNFASTFRAIGQVMHLLEDMAVPAHVRNDFKSHLDNISGIGLSSPLTWPNNPFELYVKSHPDTVTTITNPTVISATRLTDFWDTDQYIGSNPLVTTITAGLSEYTNANFASNYTIFTENKSASDPFSFPHPAKSETEYFEEYLGRHIAGKSGLYDIYGKYYRKTAGEPIKHFASAGRLHRYLSGYTEQTNTLGVDEKQVNADYANLLLPRAVGYSAGLLNYFFRGKLDMAEDGALGYRLQNLSNEEITGGIASFHLFYDEASGNRVELPLSFFDPSGNQITDPRIPLTIAPNTSSTFTVRFTPPAIDPGRSMLVFQGKLGNEENAVIGKVISPPVIYYVSKREGIYKIYRNIGGQVLQYNKRHDIDLLCPDR